jgi:hypothetical protein
MNMPSGLAAQFIHMQKEYDFSKAQKNPYAARLNGFKTRCRTDLICCALGNKDSDHDQLGKEARMIKSVGGVNVQSKHRLSCHCGAVVLELDLSDGIVDPRRCDCSMCRRRGAIVASIGFDGMTIVQGQEVLRSYQFNTKIATHYFCGICGIYTHHQRRSKPDQYGYNVACLESINPFLLTDIPVNDGVNHPLDRTTS